MSTPDEYTAKYMEGGRAIASSRMRMPGWFFALMGVILLFAGGAGVAAFIASHALAALFPLLFTVPLLTAITLLFSHLRATVTETHVIVQLGLFGPKVPLDRVESVSVEKYSMMKYGGWGIRGSLDGTTAYSVPGGNGDCVRIEYRDDKGKVRKLAVTVEDAAAFKRSIDLARSVVRVDASGSEVQTTAETQDVEIERHGADEQKNKS